jgi:hypothetical protein
MTHTPEVGDGVRVPWGLEEVDGEVVDVLNANNVVVAVPVEGASGERLDTIRATYSVDVLQDLSPWRITAIKVGSPTAGADATKAWYVDAARDGETARVEVRLSGSAAASRTVAPESRQAIQTRGRSAVQKFARRLRLPRVIVVGSSGVFAPPS